MPVIDRGQKRRARRIAADEAHSWARNLRLGNHHAKDVLKSLTLYVDGDGFCFVGIDQLAFDCELSADTVRRRLVWLEEIGAIARQSQWIDEYGRRNSDGRGKRTTDNIRLQIDADQDDLIEARARGEVISDAVSREVSPSSQPGLNPDAETVSPAPALGQPSHCSEGLISEPEPESPLKAPQGAERERSRELETEPELFAGAWSAWPGHEIMRRDLALQEFRKLPPDQQRHCRAAITPFVKMQQQFKRDTAPAFHLWIRNRGFDEFPAAATEDGVTVAASSLAVGSAEGRAVKALYGFARAPLFENRGFVVYRLAVTPQVLAFGDMPPEKAWHWITDRQQLGAWSAFLSSHIAGNRPDLVTVREGVRGMLAPWPWPPRKDGSISEDQQGAA